MKITDVMIQLERVRVQCGQHEDKVVLELDEEWKWQDLQRACSEACDILYDYEKATAQTAALVARYETAKDAIDRGAGNWQCPECQRFISFGNEYCHWCGQRLGWEQKIGRRGEKRCRKR